MTSGFRSDARPVAIATTATDKELLARIVGEDVADALWAKFGALDSILAADARALRAVTGIGDKTARGLCALRLLLERVRDYGPTVTRPVVDCPDAAAEYARAVGIAAADREHFAAILLDTKRHVLGVRTITVGLLNQSLCHPRETFRAAIREGAASVVLVHNHPSGIAEPSREDIELTKRLIRAGEVLGIGIPDHIIVTPDPCNWYSMRDDGLDLGWSC